MAQYPIQYTRRLPPAYGPTVKGDVDVRTGEEQIGEALAGAGRDIFQLGAMMKQQENQIKAERQRIQDVSSAITANSLINTAQSEHMAFRALTADTMQWEPDFKNRWGKMEAQVLALPMSADQRELMSAQLKADYEEKRGLLLLDATRREVEDIQEGATDALIKAIAGGDPEQIKRAEVWHIQAYKGKMDDAEWRRITERDMKEGLQIRQTAVEQHVQALLYQAIDQKDLKQFDRAEAVLNQYAKLLPDEGVELQRRIRVEKSVLENSLASQQEELRKAQAQTWENRYFASRRAKTDPKILSGLIEEGLKAGHIDQQRAYELEGSSKVNQDFQLSKQRVLDILNGKKKGVLAGGDDKAMLSVLTDNGIVSVTQTGDKENDIRLQAIASPTRLAEALEKSNRIPGEIAELISLNAASQEAAAVSDAILTYWHLRDKMPQEAEDALGKMDMLAQIRIESMPLSREELNDERGARKKIDEASSRIMDMEVLELDDKQVAAILFDPNENSSRKIFQELDPKAGIRGNVATLVSDKLSTGAWKQYVTKDKWFGRTEIEQADISDDMANYYAQKAAMKYRVLRANHVPEITAKEAAHDYSTQATLREYQPMAWGGKLIFIKGPDFTINERTGEDLIEAAAEIRHIQPAANLMEQYNPVWSKRHEAFVLQSKEPPFDPMFIEKKFEDYLFTWNPKRGAKLERLEDAEYQFGQTIPQGPEAQQHALMNELLERLNNGETIEILNDPKYDIEWNESNETILTEIVAKMMTHANLTRKTQTESRPNK